MINAQLLLDRKFPPLRQSYTEKDAILYALALGYGEDPVDPAQIQYAYEKQLRVVPSMVAVMCSPGFWLADPIFGVKTEMVVHAEHAIEFHKPLAPSGRLRGEMSVVDVIDRGLGKGAMIISKRLIMDEDTDRQIATIVQHTLCRGDGGFSGEQITPLTGAHPAKVVYDSNPDWSVTLKTLPQAALLYRLFADLNPLHADPEVAQKAGFDRPILHGLCTYGMVCRALLQACTDGESNRLHLLAGKFTAPVFPGDSLCIEVWKGARTGTRQTLHLRCTVPARQSVVFANAIATISA